MSSTTASRLTAVLRRPDGLFGIVSTRRAAFERPRPPQNLGENDGLRMPAGGPYLETLCPLAEIPPGLACRKQPLLRSWEALRAVETLNAEVLAHVLVVLIETIADPAADTSDVPPLCLDDPPPPIRPTAAHPRAYRGTKYKPPKRPSARRIDLRPHLSVARDEERMLARLSPHFEEAVALVEREHPYGAVLRARGRDALRPQAQCWEPDDGRQIAALPAAFRRYLLWSLRGWGWSHVRAVLAAYWALELEQDAALRRCVSHLLALNPFPEAVAWCRFCAQVPSGRRIHFAELLIESAAHLWPLDEQTIEGLRLADTLADDAVYRHRMFHALSSVKKQGSLAYANDGFALANEYQPNYEFEEVAALDGVGAAVGRFAAYARGAAEWGPALAMSLWRRCAQLDGFKSLLDDLGWQRLDPDDAIRWVGLLGDVVYEELDDDTLDRKWELLRAWAGGLLEVVTEVAGPYRSKAIRHLGELLWIWSDDVRGLAAILEPYTRLLRRICAAPFAVSGHEDYVLPDLTFIRAEHWPDIERAPDAALRKLEAAARRANDAWLLGRGLRALVYQWPRFAVGALQRFPAKLAKVARVLGVLDYVERDRLIEAFRAQPLVATDEHGAEIARLVALAEEHQHSGVMNPVSKRLRAHLRGERLLWPAQVERDAALVRANWMGLQLDVLGRVALDRMSRGLPVAEETSKVKHAFMLQQLAADHRRSLRRLLSAYLNGHTAYAEQHPRNQAWLARHPKLDAAKWTAGWRQRGTVPELGTLDLALERDPLEVLRLGSYFDTCLGVGGGLSYSAAAITLDINKQVIYARDSAGRVVARQLLAISEDDRLICFAVYPRSASRDIRRLFREFDLQFAAHLGIAVHQQTGKCDGDHYKIVPVVSQRFWDDEAWNLKITSD